MPSKLEKIIEEEENYKITNKEDFLNNVEDLDFILSSCEGSDSDPTVENMA